MKYGILSFGNKLSNIGDLIQTIGVLNVYERMGISEQELIKVNNYNLSEYSGERIVLPLAGYFNAMPNVRTFPLSPDILPVFLGFHCTDEKILHHLGKDGYDPYGCRDLATMNEIKKSFGEETKVFMSGCFTLCLEKRDDNSLANKVFLVDVIKEFYPYIPDEYIKEAEENSQITHEFLRMSEQIAYSESILVVKKWLDRLKREAKLVITSRLHLALPCIAMGIPVIVARRDNDDTDRYSGYDELFHVYLPNEYDKVDWKPKVKDIEWIKNEIFNNAKVLLKETFEKNKISLFKENYMKQVQLLSKWFEKSSYIPYYGGENLSYLSQYQKEHYFLNKNIYGNLLSYIIGAPLDNYDLVIWGTGDKGNYMMRRYEKLVIQFNSCIYVDSDPTKWNSKLHGYDICNPSEIRRYKKEKIVVIVAVNHYYSEAGRAIAMSLVNDFGLIEGKQFFMLDKLDSSGKMAIDEFALKATLM
ncbi:polysaccharide pyruvyl transferase family protein [Clostridium beijerinckii]|uniref:polysaccharide pyruvyl transferase family protein n=1 Tax=Clostridium beijerinckii TaxID=1520 RepID=UPI00232C4CCD|nr:polysaccharide pyruvyl transferase family protein [Clostridium beijerinckii]